MVCGVLMTIIIIIIIIFFFFFIVGCSDVDWAKNVEDGINTIRVFFFY